MEALVQQFGQWYLSRLLKVDPAGYRKLEGAKELDDEARSVGRSMASVFSQNLNALLKQASPLPKDLSERVRLLTGLQARAKSMTYEDFLPLSPEEEKARELALSEGQLDLNDGTWEPIAIA